eukprot:3431968-Prymnesium_polylepis.1
MPGADRTRASAKTGMSSNFLVLVLRKAVEYYDGAAVTSLTNLNAKKKKRRRRRRRNSEPELEKGET